MQNRFAVSPVKGAPGRPVPSDCRPPQSVPFPAKGPLDLLIVNEGGKTRRPLGKGACGLKIYSHSIVAGGLLVMSYTIRLIWGTSLTMRTLTRSSTS